MGDGRTASVAHGIMSKRMSVNRIAIVFFIVFPFFYAAYCAVGGVKFAVHLAKPILTLNSSIYPAWKFELDAAFMPMTIDAVDKFAVIAVEVPTDVPLIYIVTVDPLRTIAT